MSQLSLTELGDLGSIRLVEAPATLGPDEVRVAVAAAPINNSDLLLATGRYPIRPEVPFALGGEGAGTVVAAGSAAHEHLVGRRVLVLPDGAQGTWGTETMVAAAHVIPLREDGDPVQQSMLPINPATAYLLLDRFVDLHPGDWVVQDLGNSAVGRNVIALARWLGLRTLSIVRSEAAASALRANGGDVVLVAGDDPKDALDGRTARLGLTGGTAVSAVASAVEDGGHVVAYSAVTGQPPVVPLGDLVFRELSLHGLWVVRWLRSAPRPEIEATYALLDRLTAEGVLHTDVDSTFPVEKYADAFARANQGGRSGKVLFAS